MVSEKDNFGLGTEEKLLKEVEEAFLEKTEQTKRDGFFIYFCVLAVNSFTFLSGCSYSWTSPVLLKLYSNDTSINPLGEPITKLQESTIAGIPFLGCLIGPFFLSTLPDLIGRKKVLAIFGGIEILSFLLLTIASRIWIYYLSRFLIGLGYGVAMPLTSIFITEISPPHNRGRYGTMIGMFVPLGNLCSYVIGPLFSVRLFSLICLLPCAIVYPFFLWFVPDSPTSLVSKGKIKKATLVLQKLRRSENVNEEMDDILFVNKKHEDMVAEEVNLKNFLSDRVSRQGLKIAFGITLIQISTGMTIVLAFVGPIFQSVNAQISGNTVAILVGIVKLVSFTFAAGVMERFKRKTLLLYSIISISMCLFMLGMFFYLKESKRVQNIEQFSWIPIACILLYIIFYSTGIGPIGHIFYGEIFPGRFKAIAVAFVSIGSTIITFGITFSFRFAAYYLGTHTVFWMFSLLCWLGTFFVHFKVPETQGKTLLEIQQMLDKLNT